MGFHLAPKNVLLLFEDAPSYFSKFSFLFHLKNHHSKGVNLKFQLKWSKPFVYEAILYTQSGADPAAGKGGPKLLTEHGGPGGWPPGGDPESPGRGCKGAAPPCLGKFCISELNSRDLVHTLCLHYIENLLIYFQLKCYSLLIMVGLYEMGHLSCSR